MSPQQAKPTYSNYHFQDLPQSSQYFWNVYYNRDIHAGALPSGSLQSRGPGLLNQLHDKANLLSSSKKGGRGSPRRGEEESYPGPELGVTILEAQFHSLHEACH